MFFVKVGGILFSAYAEVVPEGARCSYFKAAFLRVCGGSSAKAAQGSADQAFSPRMRR
ncbi:Hypothetical protein CulFRC58_1880 [Corynebacterium ulcerans FRC58]|uniref:Uncharacterized protein n=1 Tax=Corynebacterium ulcerans FRC58 TaxID=1408268 RepID=A0ABN4H1D4_CORUL|nr:Hypothetical protein CulFRC58_1880 [Corynebacterium ulcerans FRC58]